MCTDCVVFPVGFLIYTNMLVHFQNVTWTIIIRQFILFCLLLLCLGAVLTSAFALHVENEQKLENENADKELWVSDGVRTNKARSFSNIVRKKRVV